MNIVNLSIEKIKPYEKNAKKHPEKQIEKIALSLKEFGFNQPIVIDTAGVIIVGHGRFAAAKKLGMNEVPTLTLDLTEEQAKAYRLADNKLNESDWDMGLVIDELKELSTDMVVITGFDTDLLLEDDEKDDEIPDKPQEPKSKLGDLYEFGGHRILCGDSTKEEDVQKLMQKQLADLVITDPPYNVDYEGGTGLKIENDSMGDSQFLEFLSAAFINFSKYMKQGASFYIWHADLEGLNFRQACKNAALVIKQCIIWNKNSLVMGRQDYQWKHEPCLYGWKEGASHNWYGDRDKTTVYDIPSDPVKAFQWFKRRIKDQEDKSLSVLNYNKPLKNAQHPTMKPIELLEKQVVNSSKQGDIVLDLFLGSGSTMIASQKTGRFCYGMELDPKYVDVIVQRYVDYTGDKNIIKNGKSITW